MKAHLRYWNGYWWCRRLGFDGCGSTPQAAYDDTWPAYFDAVRPVASWRLGERS